MPDAADPAVTEILHAIDGGAGGLPATAYASAPVERAQGTEVIGVTAAGNASGQPLDDAHTVFIFLKRLQRFGYFI